MTCLRHRYVLGPSSIACMEWYSGPHYQHCYAFLFVHSSSRCCGSMLDQHCYMLLFSAALLSVSRVGRTTSFKSNISICITYMSPMTRHVSQGLNIFFFEGRSFVACLESSSGSCFAFVTAMGSRIPVPNATFLCAGFVV